MLDLNKSKAAVSMFKLMDWTLLAEQKRTLNEIQVNLEGNQFEVVEGLLNLLDAVQDAGEELGYPAYAHLKNEEEITWPKR